MIKTYLYSVAVLCLLIFHSCSRKNINSDGFILYKVRITDSILRDIANDYINEYPFDGKGIYLITTKNINDTLRYYVGITFSKEGLNTILRKSPYYLFDIINERVIIVNTKWEKLFEPQTFDTYPDTIMNKYYEPNSSAMIREEYFIEYTWIDTSLTKRVIYFNPY